MIASTSFTPGDAARVDLADVDRLGLEELLEDDAVRDVLAGGDADRRDLAPDARVAEDVVGARRLFHPPRLELGERLRPRDRVVDAPDLVRVHHQDAVGTEDVADERRAACVRLEVLADLHLDVPEAVVQSCAHERRHLRVVVAEPAGRRRVRRVALGDDLQFALGLAARRRAKEVDGLVRREDVVDVAEVDRGDELLRREMGEELPEGQADALRPQVPDGVDDGAGSEVDDALLGAEPAQLVVGDERAPEAAHVRGDPVERAADHQRLERVDGRDADLGAAPVREGEAVAAVLVVRVEDDIGGRVVRARVHRVRPVERAGGREPHVVDAEAADLHLRRLEVGLIGQERALMRGIAATIR